MARAIDGDALKRWCEKIIDQACHPATVQIGEVFLDKVRSMPTLTPPTQEQLERVWPGCSFCKNDGVQDYRTAVCVTRWGMSYLKGPEIESDDIFYAQNHFCRFCGRPLTLEAWKEMRKRWEAANDAD